MAETIYRVLDCEIKKLGDRNYEFTASTSAVDREDEVIEAKGWDLRNFKKNPVIMYAHDYRSLPIGRAPRVWISGDALKNTVEFPPEGTYEFADIVERLVDTGYLRAESVGFLPKKWEDGDGKGEPKRTYLKQELLEISLVPVPAHPDALLNAVEAGVITTKELETLSEGDIVNKPEETETHIRIPVRDCKVTATIDISKKEGIQGLYCGKIKKVRTYIFDKRPPYNWTMAKAKAWVKEHDDGKALDEGIEIEEKNTPRRKDWECEISQEGLKDELDFLIKLVQMVGLNDEAKEVAWELMREIMRLAGDDIPDDIRDTIGVTITGEQELKVRDAIDYLEDYLTKINVAVEEADEPPIIVGPRELDEAQIVELVQKTVTQVIEKAQGKID